ncbi:MAG TPA: histidine phosphatase family protein [Xanthomonadales bacterium]|nr:histidine phosphatase family protein [Xanthomonadales bacterium]
MTELVVVRHGQASFRSANYDQLSELGWRQSRLLGEWLAVMHGDTFDAVHAGAMVRHRETGAAIREAYVARGLALPEVEIDEGFNEFDHQAVIRRYAAGVPEHPAVRAMAAGRHADARDMFDLLRAALVAWASGEIVDGVPEPWSVFQARVRGAAQRLSQACAGHGRVLVLTSGGVMAQLAQLALDVPNERAVQLNLSIRNSALAEFHAGDDGIKLASWNAVPHLAAAEHRELWTHY